MKREIKFKAKRVDNNEWIEGLFAYISFKQKDELGNWGEEYKTPAIQDSNDVFIPINIDTLCQFTGLKDKNGVEIYEGDDVCNMGTSGNSITSRCVVVYDSEGAAFKIKEYYREMWNGTEVSPKSYLMPFLSTLKYEVTGNIYD